MAIQAVEEQVVRSSASGFRYDLFVVHADADEWFVKAYLLDRLGLASDRVLTPKTLQLGRFVISEIEWGVQSSRVTVVVLSFAYVNDHWAEFGEQIAAYAHVARDASRTLLPLLLQDCEIPLHIRALTLLDFRNPARDVWEAEIDRLRRYLGRPSAPDRNLPCPYPGMRPFTQDDTARFFGRDPELDRMLHRLRRGVREIYVIGASGSGKSSLILAGLAPRLARGVEGLPRFHVRVFRPGERPLDRLAAALDGEPDHLQAAVEALLARNGPTGALLLVIDQLEELFVVAGEVQRRAFLATLPALRADSRCVLVFTLRADFYGSFMESPLWIKSGGRVSRIDLGRPQANDLRMVIERPARDLGVYFEPELVSRLLDDTAHEPGALPLLQETLLRLWDKRRGRLLTLADYRGLGDGSRTGLAFAIKEHADEVIEALTVQQKAIALRIFLRLVAFGEGRADTRRQQPRSTLRSDGETAADFEAVLQRIVENRLLTITGDEQRDDVRIDLAHEILIHAWPTLADWIKTWRALEQHRRELEATAVAWRMRGGGNGGLLDAFELASALAWRAKAVTLGHSSELESLLVASHAALNRAIRRRRRIISLVAGPLLVLGIVAVSQVYMERNRANRAAALAETQRAEAERRAEELTLTQARYSVDVNPTRAVLMLKPLAVKYWREVRAIAAAAHVAGVVWILPAARETLSLEIGHDGTRAVSGGQDGVVRVHDLVRRATQPVLDLHVPVMARFGDDDRRIVAWHDRQLVIADAATGQRREVTAQRPITDLKVVGTTAYWVDGSAALWQLDLVGTALLARMLDEPVTALAPSPDGRWIALAGEHRMYLLDHSQPDVPARWMMRGTTYEMEWSSDSEYLTALTDDSVISYRMSLGPGLEARHMVGARMSVARHGDQIYALGSTGVVIIDPNGSGRRSISGRPVGLIEARGGTMIAGASDGITVISDDGDRMLPLPAARVERVVASPRSPYLLAQVEGRLLLWNLDDIQPRRLLDNPTGRALFADPDRVITAGTLDLATQAIDVTTRVATPLGQWPDLQGVASAGPGRALAVVDGEHHLHLVVPGRPPQDLPGEIDIAAFATQTQLVLTTLDGQVLVHDVASGQRAPLVERPSPLLGLTWGRGHHAWVAAAFADGTLWRKNLATGATQAAIRVPALDPRRLTARDGKLLVAADGGVTFLHDGEIHRWRADGAIDLLARAPKPLEEFGEAGADHLIAIAADTTIYAIDLSSVARPADAREALASIASSSAATSPDTGTLVAIERGALTILDPLVHQRWTLAAPNGVAFVAPAISADGRRVVASTPRSLLAWSIDLPDSAEATVRWLDEMTNAVDDRTPGGLGWR